MKLDLDTVKIWLWILFMFVIVPALFILGIWNAVDCWNRPIIEAPTRCISR